MGTVTMTGVGKAFKHYPSRWRRLFDWLLPFGEQHYESHWVLRDITIDIKAGEAVALVGMNGAGKSTLLKLISGTLQPTTGTIEVQGRLAALLELGIGFHPDFTGRQNVFMAGQLLGLTQSEIQALMPEIEAFAEIGDYIDQPVRVYSSGMQVRLAFSIATAQRPDVLVIDEALSVGDAHFQHKSFERIQEYRALGTTLLIVSHDKNAIQTICDRVVILNQGQLVVQGAPDAMFDVYNALIAKADEKNLVKEASESGALQLVTGSGEAKVTSIRLFDESEQCDVAVVSVGQRVCLDVVVAIHSEIPKLVFGFSIRNRLGQVMYGTNTFFTNQAITNLKSGETYKFSVRLETNLGPGIYSLSTALVNSSNHLDANYEWRDRALTFEVVNSNKPFFEGQTYLSPTIEVH